MLSVAVSGPSGWLSSRYRYALPIAHQGGSGCAVGPNRHLDRAAARMTRGDRFRPTRRGSSGLHSVRGGAVEGPICINVEEAGTQDPMHRQGFDEILERPLAPIVYRTGCCGSPIETTPPCN